LSGSCAVFKRVSHDCPQNASWLVRAPGGENLFVTHCDTGGGQCELYYLQPASTTSPSTWDWPYTRLTASSDYETYPCFLPTNKEDATVPQ
jgi:hypothetical protein